MSHENKNAIKSKITTSNFFGWWMDTDDALCYTKAFYKLSLKKYFPQQICFSIYIYKIWKLSLHSLRQFIHFVLTKFSFPKLTFLTPSYANVVRKVSLQKKNYKKIWVDVSLMNRIPRNYETLNILSVKKYIIFNNYTAVITLIW